MNTSFSLFRSWWSCQQLTDLHTFSQITLHRQLAAQKQLVKADCTLGHPQKIVKICRHCGISFFIGIGLNIKESPLLRP